MSDNEPKTLRIVYEYDANGVRPLYRQLIDMVPPSRSAVPAGAGLELTLLGADDTALISRNIADPIRHDTEVFSADPTKSLHREPVQKPHGIFEVLLPADPRAHSVSITRAAHGATPAAHLVAAAPLKHSLGDIPVLKEPRDG